MTCVVETARVAVVHDAQPLGAGVSRCALRLRWLMISAMPRASTQAQLQAELGEGVSPVWTGAVLRAGVGVVVVSCGEPDESIGGPLRRLARHWRRPAIVGLVPAGHMSMERWLRQQGVDVVLSGTCEESEILDVVEQLGIRVGAEVA